MKKIIVTGGAGFIGSTLIRLLIRETNCEILNIDKLTYAANLKSLSSIEENPRYTFVQFDICESQKLQKVFEQFQPDAVIHLAAETHVDRSIDDAGTFIQTNFVGTYKLLEKTRQYYNQLSIEKKKIFRFLHVSTDEVYGSLGKTGAFSEQTPYAPHSPYSASKAASDHLVMAWFHTYNLPVLMTHCSNNYGPYQFPEKLIPLILLNAIEGKVLPIYGNGENSRDWLYVEDHARALYNTLKEGVIGQSYNIGGHNERTTLEVVQAVCLLLDKWRPKKTPYAEQIVFVEDRPGHDLRYAMNTEKIEKHLHWYPLETFETGLEKTVLWYLENSAYWRPIRDKKYSGERLGRG